MFAPMSLGDLLDGAFALFRQHFKPLVGVAAVCYGPMQAISLYGSLSGGWVQQPILLMVFLLVSAVGALVGAAAIVKIVSDGYLERETSIPEAIAFAYHRAGGLMVAGFAKYVLVMLASLALLIPGIIVACGYSVVSQVVVLEDLPRSTDALGRSWALTKGHRGTAFGLAFVLYLVASIPGFVAGMLATTGLAVPAMVLGSLGAIVLTPLVACGFTLFYYDMRVRKEAFDLQMLEKLLQPGA
jgi:uncharacterized membrane protein